MVAPNTKFCGAAGGGVPQVADDGGHPGVAPVPDVKDADGRVPAVRQEGVHQVAAQEARAAGDEGSLASEIKQLLNGAVHEIVFRVACNPHTLKAVLGAV